MKTVRMLCIMVGSVLAAFLVPLAARAWLASPRPVEAPVPAAVWGPYKQFISDNGYDSGMNFYPALAAVDSTVCAAWSQQVGYDSEHYDPYYTNSLQSGELGQWEGRFSIHNTWPITTETTRVDVAVDSGGGLHFVWSEYTQTPYSYTLYYSSTIGVVMETIAQTNDSLAAPAIAVSDDKVHLVWAQGWGRINYRERGSSGWGTTVTIISSTQRATHPTIEVGSDGKVHAVWSGGAIDKQADIFYKNSSNWSTPPLELFNETNVGGRSPAMAVSGSNVYVVWCEFVSDGEQYIRFRQSESGSWGPSERIFGSPLAANKDSPNWLRPAVAVDINEKIHLAFNGAGAVSDPEDIYYAYRKPGEDWRCCENVTQSGGNDTTPAIATGGQYVHLIWAGPPSPFDLEGNDYEVSYKRADIDAEMDREDLYLPIIMKSAS